ncbi:hypothetical protein DEDE109153_08175 [Deinococcus deserti]|uniref:Uncharacterized protein n=1 Tax=Deinococcus deserti (strain DSM 17065 / CIP 109153 / LMG 22923 / VCD115) TaxID=546414 RepID=C1D3P4_DEIDV|nr:hypothetical protein [Deinococcus deserti]ACO48123.1 Hypothetical protein Deide_3p01770 [Deinococcus deserti VCD115]
MPDRDWMVGAKYSTPRLETHLEELRNRQQQLEEHKVAYLSRLLEYQVLKDEQKWRKEHPKDR